MFGLTTTRRLRTEVAAAKTETDRYRAERDKFREDAALWHGRTVRASEMYTDTAIVNDCLTEDATRAGWRLRIARKAAARILAAYVAEQRRADRLQRRLDGMCGLDDPAVLAGATWQDRREQKMRYDA